MWSKLTLSFSNIGARPFHWLMWMTIPKLKGISARLPSLDWIRCTIPIPEWKRFKLLEKVSDSRPLTELNRPFHSKMWMVIPVLMGIKAQFPSLDTSPCMIPIPERERVKLSEEVSGSRPLTRINNRFPSLMGITRSFHSPDRRNKGTVLRPKHKAKFWVFEPEAKLTILLCWGIKTPFPSTTGTS